MPASAAQPSTPSESSPDGMTDATANAGATARSGATRDDNDGATADGAVDPNADGDADADEAPLNRAERRAKGKKKAQPPVVGKIQPGRVNNGGGNRSYANRRSG